MLWRFIRINGFPRTFKKDSKNKTFVYAIDKKLQKLKNEIIVYLLAMDHKKFDYKNF